MVIIKNEFPSFLPPLVGTEGFAIPSLHSIVHRIPISNSSDSRLVEALGIELQIDEELQCPSGQSALLIFAEEKSQRRLKIRLGKGASSNRLFLFGDKGLNGRYNIHGKDNCIIDCGNQHNSSITANFWGHKGLLYWGRGSTSNGMVTELKGTGDSVLVGEDCMLATDIVMRPTDMHAVFRVSDGCVLNNLPGTMRGIVLYPHVWLAQGAAILKDVTIGPGSIVGAGAVVTRDVPSNTAVGGNPARVLTSDVSWTRTLNPQPEDIAQVAGSLKKYIRAYDFNSTSSVEKT